MRSLIKVLLLLLLPASLCAQNPAEVKKQATIVADALLAGNYGIVIDHTYPKAVKMAGGKDKLVQMVANAMKEMNARNISFVSVVMSEPDRFYKAGMEIHCLIPEKITLKMDGDTFSSVSHLLGISSDQGRTWSFLDLTKSSIPMMPKLFPNFNKDLVIPQPTKPTLLSD